MEDSDSHNELLKTHFLEERERSLGTDHYFFIRGLPFS